MICPECRSEFREGFTQCSTCGVNLVVELPPPETRGRGRLAPVPESQMFPYCGFLDLEDARRARAELHESGVWADVLVREVDDGSGPREEFWIRVPRQLFGRAETILDTEPTTEASGDENGGDGETFTCSACGRDVAVDASSCPHCGAEFEE